MGSATGVSAAVRRSGRARAWGTTAGLVAAAIGVAVWATAAVWSGPWVERPFDRATAVMALLPAWLLPLAVALLAWRRRVRPASLTWVLAVAWSSWIALAASGGALAAWSGVPLVVVRPVAFALVVSWPTGRLERGPGRAIAVYTALEVCCWLAVPVLVLPDLAVEGYRNPFAVADLPRLAEVAGSFMVMLVLPVGAVVLGAVSLRRYRAPASAARDVIRPVAVAGLVVAAGDLTLAVADHLDAVLADDGGWTLAGMLIVSIDWLRFGVLALALMVGARRMHGLARGAARIRVLERPSPSGAASVEQAVRNASDDPTARVVFARAEGWVDAAGHPADVGGPGRVVTPILRDGVPVAAVDREAVAGGLTVVEAAVAAAGATVEIERLEALARARRDDAVRARRAIVRISDATTRRVQRDLHDGAQQRLVGLDLQVQLARAGRGHREGEPSLADALAEGIAATRDELRRLVDGDPVDPRPLGEAMSALAATIPMAVHLDVDVPVELPEHVRATAWFAAAEATTNAVKHSCASSLCLRAAIRDGALGLEVVDDGDGGADPEGDGLAGLRDRVERAGGRLCVESRPGVGTSVRVDLPLGARP